MKKILALSLCVFPVLAHALAHAAALGNPGHNQHYSGIGVISGWKCDATGPLTVRFNEGDPIPLAYGNRRTDTRSVCGDDNNGFVSIWNWASLGDGTHTAVVYDNEVEFARSTFHVMTTGEEFLRGAEAEVWVEDFPAPSERTLFVWNQNTQHLELAEVGQSTHADIGACAFDTVQMLMFIDNRADVPSLDQWDQTSLLMSRLQPEAVYGEAWCVAQGGQVEVRLRDGTRADCVLPKYAVEADFANKWYEGVGQAAHYAHLLQKRPGVLLILEHPNDCYYLAQLCAVLTGLRFQQRSIKVWTTGPVSCLPLKG